MRDHYNNRQQRDNRFDGEREAPDHQTNYGGNRSHGRGYRGGNNNYYQREENRNGGGRWGDNRNHHQHGGYGYGGGRKKFDRQRELVDQWNNNRSIDRSKWRRPQEIEIKDENTMNNMSDRIPRNRPTGNNEVFLYDKGPGPVPACLKKEEEIKDLSKLNKNTWDHDDWTWEDKICSQMDDLPEGRGLQFLTDDLFPTYCLKEDTEDFFEEKKAAADAALEEICKVIGQTKANIKRETQTLCKAYTYQVVDDEDFDSDDAMNEEPYSEKVEFDKKSGSVVNFNYDIELLKAWSKALPYNLLFLVGFEVLGLSPSDELNCHCPCGPKMTKWRLQFGLEGKCERHDQCTRHKRFEPSGLMAHLAEQYGDGKGGYIHGLIELYIRKLYAGHNNGYGHKALYKAGDDQYKRAVAEERKHNIKARKKLEEENEKYRRELKESNERERKLKEETMKFQQLNKDQFDKIERLQKDMDFLKISPDTTAKKTSEIDLQIFKGIFNAYIESLKNMHFENKKETEKPIKLEVSSEFSLQDLFTSWNKSKDKDTTYLFRDLHHKQKQSGGYHNWRIFLKWDVVFKSNIVTNRKVAKDITADDDGGPTREFISQVCKQMGSLSVPVDMRFLEEVKTLKKLKVGTKVCIYVPHNGIEERREGMITNVRMNNSEVTYEVKGKDFKVDSATNNDVEVVEAYIQLFEKHDGGFVPVTDEVLENEINSLTNSETDKKDILVTVKTFYRAIGRITCHCIVSFDKNNQSNYPIASESLPLFFRNVILRGVRPGDKDYRDEDVISHLNEIGVSNFKNYVGLSFNNVFFDNDNEMITKENICTKLIPTLMLDSRKISIEAITEGLTLNGMLNFQSFFRPIPLDVVSKLIFGIPVISAEDVIKILKPQYNGESYVKIGDSIEYQEDFFKNTIPTVLKDMDESEKADKANYEKLVSERKTFIMRFVKFCTGFDFLPDPVMNPNFRILVHFSFEEMNSDHYPVAHSCVNELKLPGDIYHNSIDEFKEKLSYVCQYSKNVGFDMN